mgnify:CR=1 FL=1
MSEERREEEELEIEETEEEEEEEEKREEQRKRIEEIIRYAIRGTIATTLILLIVGSIFRNRTLQGISIISIAGLLLLLRVVHKPYHWIIELFGQYFDVWKPRFLPYVIIPGIMTVKSKIPYKSTIIIDLYMDEIEHIQENGEKKKRSKLDFEDDSAIVTIRSTVEVFDVVAATYKVTTEGGWKYLVQEMVDSLTRGFCGRIKLDEAIKSRIELTEEERKKAKKEYIELSISKRIEKQADEALKEYGIDFKAVLITDIRLHEDTEKQRRAIHLAGKKVEEEAFNLKAAEKRGIGEGLEKSREITEIIRLVKEETGETLTPLQVMTYIRQKDLLEAAGKGTLIATGAGLEKGIADIGAIAAGISGMLKKKEGE